MRIEKKGLVFSPNQALWWQQHYAILPTPIYLMQQNCIRIYFATTCKELLGRISYVDVAADNPKNICANPETIVLDLGREGAFDDCGVNPSCVLPLDNGKYGLFYAGYQRHFRTPYSIFSGLAVSHDLTMFERVQETPILERTSSELNLRSAPSVFYQNGRYCMVYVADMGWTTLNNSLFNNKVMPTYGLKMAFSDNGVHWSEGNFILKPQKNEFGFGRPYIIYKNGLYYLFYSIRRVDVSYRIGYAVSQNGSKWERRDDIEGLDVSETGWDSQMVCYGAVIDVGAKTYMFYNGNENGKTGFGLAEIIYW